MRASFYADMQSFFSDMIFYFFMVGLHNGAIDLTCNHYIEECQKDIVYLSAIEDFNDFVSFVNNIIFTLQNNDTVKRENATKWWEDWSETYAPVFNKYLPYDDDYEEPTWVKVWG